ncbi:MAG TPA: Fe-S cluster assembly protein SufB, partial [Tenericutes bacterium]|nr:Fe-S cluster assembly protein SufB [Mycoplasmatota bacterium]
WGINYLEIDFDKIKYYLKTTDEVKRSWDDVPKEIRDTFNRLGIPKAEQKYLAGISTQFESEVVYRNMIKEIEKKGVIFLDTDTALKKHPDFFKKYFNTLVPYTDNKFAALNSAVWSGGVFIYVPKGVKLELPLQSYFRINSPSMGQFERTLIIVDEGAELHYIEGCTAPTYTDSSLHAAVVEIFVKKNATCRYTTIQNWAGNVYNLVTKRAICEKGATMEWVDGNIGSKATMKYPAVILKGEGAKGTCISIAVAGENQIQDAGAKMIHLAPNTKSTIISKSISKNGGNTIYRGIVKMGKDAKNAKSKVECDTLIMDGISSSETVPVNILENETAQIEHEATVSKISEEKLFYLTSRGIDKEKAEEMIVMGFIEPFSRELPMEYAVELNQLLRMSFENSIG